MPSSRTHTTSLSSQSTRSILSTRQSIAQARIARARNSYDPIFRGMQRMLYAMGNLGSYDDQINEIISIPFPCGRDGRPLPTRALLTIHQTHNFPKIYCFCSKHPLRRRRQVKIAMTRTDRNGNQGRVYLACPKRQCPYYLFADTILKNNEERILVNEYDSQLVAAVDQVSVSNTDSDSDMSVDDPASRVTSSQLSFGPGSVGSASSASPASNSIGRSSTSTLFLPSPLTSPSTSPSTSASASPMRGGTESPPHVYEENEVTHLIRLLSGTGIRSSAVDDLLTGCDECDFVMTRGGLTRHICMARFRREYAYIDVDAEDEEMSIDRV